MIDRCFNPTCKRKLDYLRDGRVVRVIRGKNEGNSVEHFWLCGPCYRTHDFEFHEDGSVSLKARSGDNSADDLLIGELHIRERRNITRASRLNREPNLDGKVA